MTVGTGVNVEVAVEVEVGEGVKEGMGVGVDSIGLGAQAKRPIHSANDHGRIIRNCLRKIGATGIEDLSERIVCVRR